MWIQCVMGALGLASGFVVASGVVALLISLRMIPRFAGITKTAMHITRYETVLMLGVVTGSVLQQFGMDGQLTWLYGSGWVSLAVHIILALFGLLAGVFLGSWIVALGETVNIYPIIVRRCSLTWGIGWVIAALALGKIAGSLLFFIRGWTA